MNFAYDNITISGGIGVGTTTLLHNLEPYLAPKGFTFQSTGQFIREYTHENVMPVATLVSDDFDRKIEKKVLTILTNKKKQVIEGWLAGFVARKLARTLRVLLTCSNVSLKIDRIANRDKLTIADAKKMVAKRESENFKKWKTIYGDYNFHDPMYYHLVIDTYSSGQQETVDQVLGKLGFV